MHIPVRQPSASPAGAASVRLSAVRLGDMNQNMRNARVQDSYRRYILRIMIALMLVASLLATGIVAYNSDLFMIRDIQVKGVDHLTAEDMTALASVPAGTTLLRVDEAGIKNRLAREAWVKDVSVNRLFPDVLELAITERSIAAVVEVPVENAQKTEVWAIASGGMWLMPIPPQDSPEAASVSPHVYEDAASVLRIVGVPYGLTPATGVVCDDDNVNNALDIVDGLTTELAGQVKTVSATGTQTTTLILNNGIEIAFGAAENIREKERVCLELMNKHPGKISYINVRVVDRPAWRSID
ncbi:MAG: FtsQ-type POTRA domain-containing protein [Coriobacteriaceae bacterium]|jgi:cell division protein FtsQ|nr:FtsQ-type POTRA domain-containing protein [Coriobacteriaceae bacterium]